MAPAFPPMPVGVAVYLFFTMITLYVLIFGRNMEIRGRLVGFLCATVSFVVGITPQSYVWLDTNGTVVSARLLIPEFGPGDPLTGDGIVFAFNLILLVLSLVFVMYDALELWR